MFCSDELIKSVDVSECSLSDHCLIKTETYIPVDPITIQDICINLPFTSFEKFYFNSSDWKTFHNLSNLQTGSMSMTRFYLMNSSLWQ